MLTLDGHVDVHTDRGTTEVDTREHVDVHTDRGTDSHC